MRENFRRGNSWKCPVKLAHFDLASTMLQIFHEIPEIEKWTFFAEEIKTSYKCGKIVCSSTARLK